MVVVSLRNEMRAPRKQNKQRINICLDRGTRKAAEHLASCDHRSLSSYLATLVHREYERRFGAAKSLEAAK